MFGAAGYYHWHAGETVWELVLLAAAGEALWGFAVWIYERVKSDDKVTKFKSVATTFKERTMDRTRQLFGNRGQELERYIDLLEDSRRMMREIQ